MSKEKIHRNPLKGNVVAVSKDARTIKVEIPRVICTPKYEKYLNRVSKIFADSNGHADIKIGQKVELIPSRPLSKTKFWKVFSVKS